MTTVVGRDSFFYLIHFEKIEDLEDMCAKGPWVVDGALLVLEKWRPNLVINRLRLNLCLFGFNYMLYLLSISTQN